MACFYKRVDSKYWWVKYISAQGKPICESSKIIHGSNIALRAIRSYVAQVAQHEFKPRNHDVDGRFVAWVPDWINVRYAASPKSLLRYRQCWHSIAIYLKEFKVAYPRELKRAHVTTYISWRTNPPKNLGVYVGHHNTALLELKFLGLVMSEAISRELCEISPCHGLRIPRIPPKPKPELSDEEIMLIREALQDQPEWMKISFEIALQTGCRLSETRIALNHINFKTRTITHAQPKGGASKAFTAPFPETLLPVLLNVKKQKRSYTVDFPPMPSKVWFKFFQKIAPHLCFHCTRVTFINRHADAGTPRDVIMKLVNHASEAVHEIYRRRQTVASVDVANKLVLPR